MFHVDWNRKLCSVVGKRKWLQSRLFLPNEEGM
nr:MAG TPA: hypothetical protein [Caudoviricetes sp.]